MGRLHAEQVPGYFARNGLTGMRYGPYASLPRYANALVVNRKLHAKGVGLTPGSDSGHIRGESGRSRRSHLSL
jgi:hypothetical protein